MKTLYQNLIYRPNRWLDEHEPVKFFGMLGYIVFAGVFSVLFFGPKTFAHDISELTILAVMIIWRFLYLYIPKRFDMK